MLFHGTSRKGATAIFKEGFKNSERGWFGKGVYMTDCSNIALDYSGECNPDYSTSYNTVFINEVLETEKLQTYQYDCSEDKDHIDTPLKNQFNKHVYKSSSQATDENYKKDHKGRKYINIGHDYSSAYDEYVAEERVTIPRYLILFEYEL